MAKTDPLIVEPYLLLTIPSNDYTFFANAAVGQNENRAEVGVTFTYQSPFSNFFFSVAPGYEFVEETLGYNIDHWRLDAEVGYFLSPRLAVRAFLSGREGDGLALFPRRDDELWYQHDRLTPHNYINVGLGVDWTLDERYQLSSAVLRMAHADWVHILEYAISFQLLRSF